MLGEHLVGELVYIGRNFYSSINLLDWKMKKLRLIKWKIEKKSNIIGLKVEKSSILLEWKMKKLSLIIHWKLTNLILLDWKLDKFNLIQLKVEKFNLIFRINWKLEAAETVFPHGACVSNACTMRRKSVCITWAYLYMLAFIYNLNI